MKSNNIYLESKDKMLSLFEEHKGNIFQKNLPEVSKLRRKAIDAFSDMGFPTTKLEAWKNTDLTKSITKTYAHFADVLPKNVNVNDLIRCEVHDFDTHITSLLNGVYINEDRELKELENGIIMGSLSAAMEKYPDLVQKYFGKLTPFEDDAMVALNAAFANDGIFIYVPDNVEADKAFQMISVINHTEDLFLQNRNLVIIGKNSKIKMLQCDDSTNHLASFNNSVTEVFLDDGAQLEHFKLQNLNDDSTLINTSCFEQGANSKLLTNAITLNGGLIRNNTRVTLNGQGAHADIFGVYLMDKKQHVDNQVYVDHAVPNCYSNELFKGIMDEDASGAFKGHILVRKDAQKTNAFQNNKNILLTDTASVDTQPFLEIYADDVKCSHGATVGQLDTEAMFYLRTRGITEANARMLLMYAFAAEVINTISIDSLRVRIDDMVKRRLRGELSVCDKCVLHCSAPEKEIRFDIDMSKV